MPSTGHSITSEGHNGFFFISSCRGGRDLTMELLSKVPVPNNVPRWYNNSTNIWGLTLLPDRGYYVCVLFAVQRGIWQECYQWCVVRSSLWSDLHLQVESKEPSGAQSTFKQSNVYNTRLLTWWVHRKTPQVTQLTKWLHRLSDAGL